jgi:hypothetical protein
MPVGVCSMPAMLEPDVEFCKVGADETFDGAFLFSKF